METHWATTCSRNNETIKSEEEEDSIIIIVNNNYYDYSSRNNYNAQSVTLTHVHFQIKIVMKEMYKGIFLGGGGGGVVVQNMLLYFKLTSDSIPTCKYKGNM